MTEPNWVPWRAVIAIQGQLMAEHGDLEAALGCPMHLHAHAESPPSLQRLAAAYGFALARGHCFPDGNERVALAIIDVFLRMNGLALAAAETDAVDTILALAAGELTEAALADWITANSSPAR
jgi:death-on-curing protein